jgi:hypothetical protein
MIDELQRNIQAAINTMQSSLQTAKHVAENLPAERKTVVLAIVAELEAKAQKGEYGMADFNETIQKLTALRNAK